VQTNLSIESLTKDVKDLKNLVLDLTSYLQEEQDNMLLGDWVSSKRIMKLTGLSTSSLYRLRKTGKVRSSFIVGKGMFYMSIDFKKLLDANHRLK